MSLQNLASIVAPPRLAPRPPNSWAVVEATIGSALPSDYKHFIGAFGAGRLARFIWIFDPFTEVRTVNLLEQFPEHLAELRTLAEEFGEELPFDLYPKRGGLLPVGVTDNGDLIHWLTAGPPNEWPIVVCDARSPQHEVFASDLTTFLCRILLRIETCHIFPQDFPPSEITFETATT